MIRRFCRWVTKWITFSWHLIRLTLPPPLRPSSYVVPLVVSLTTIPRRAGVVWLTLESLLRQTVRPLVILLVLSEAQFPSKVLPRSINSRLTRGVTILWEKEDHGSYKKLLPALKLFPNSDIVTVDDDTIYGPRMIEQFIKRSLEKSASIVGSRGAVVPPAPQDGALEPYVSWPSAQATTAGNIFLTGHGGVFYPGGVFEGTPILDQLLALRLCPNQDDIWFWAMASLAGVDRVITSSTHYFQVPLRAAGEGLFQRNEMASGNDRGLARVVQYFEIRP